MTALPVWSLDGVHLSIHVNEPGGAIETLRKHCESIEYLTVHAVHIHEDHKRFVVQCTARRGAERLVPKTWEGVPVVRRMGNRGAP